MTHSEKHLGTTVSDDQTTLHYSAYKIEYDESSSPTDSLDEHETLGEVANGYFSEHEGYTLVSNETTRDDVCDLLDNAEISYEVSEYAPTPEEEYLIERAGATNDSEIDRVLENERDLVDREMVSGESKERLAQTIGDLDSDEAVALEVLYEIVTGESVDETLDKA